MGGVSCCELIAAAYSLTATTAIMQEKEGEGRERQEGSDANNRRFSEDSALGKMMHRMSPVSAP